MSAPDNYIRVDPIGTVGGWKIDRMLPRSQRPSLIYFRVSLGDTLAHFMIECISCFDGAELLSGPPGKSEMILTRVGMHGLAAMPDARSMREILALAVTHIPAVADYQRLIAPTP